MMATRFEVDTANRLIDRLTRVEEAVDKLTGLLQKMNVGDAIKVNYPDFDMDVKAVAKEAGCCQQTVRRAIQLGQLKASCGSTGRGPYKVRRSEFLRWTGKG